MEAQSQVIQLDVAEALLSSMLLTATVNLIPWDGLIDSSQVEGLEKAFSYFTLVGKTFKIRFMMYLEAACCIIISVNELIPSIRRCHAINLFHGMERYY